MKLELPKFSTKIEYETEKITLIEEFQGKVYHHICDTKEQCMRDALIKLGWTPPNLLKLYLEIV